MKLKNVIIVLIIILIIMICILIILINNKKNKEKYIAAPETKVPIDIQEDIHLVKNHSIFSSIESFIKKFLLYSQVGNKEAVYNILDESYIKENDITKENVLNYVQELNESDTKLITRSMHVSEQEKNETYYINAILEKDHNGKQLYFKLYWDKSNSTCSIIPITFEDYSQELKENKNTEGKHIEKNNYNSIKITVLSEEEKATKIFEDFIHNEIYYTEYTYNTLLNDGYKEARFGSLDKYKEYINTNYEDLTSMDISSIKKQDEFANDEEYNNYLKELKRNELDSYLIENNAEYKRYICFDTIGNCYIFDEMEPFNYRAILDDYTIDTPEFIEKYNSTTDQGKVVLNIDKFFKALNDKNYKYAYNCLADSFKGNYFKTQTDFENYVKQNLYSNTEVEYKVFDKQGDVYTYSLILTNKETKEQMTKTFIMKLNNETKFELSFNI